jgi:hypothetical protein
MATDRYPSGDEPLNEISNSAEEDYGKIALSSMRLDPEVAKYAVKSSQTISDPDSRRLRRLIDQRVLLVMVFTYFLQTLDKGTVSFASIMHFPEDLNLHGQQVSVEPRPDYSGHDLQRNSTPG